ncbi:hypothetical protein, partial [Psychrobacter ciconiae]|uniref:hypothetical protein n=1 Tax=Psychrobacter ciconiae TaxID=1553449 RepID=UPI00166100C8
VTSGIGYTATLTDDDGVVSIKGNAKAEAPAAQYQINFAGLSRNELSSFGGSTTVTFRVNDKNGGVIADQIVAAVLPKTLTDNGLVSLDGSSTQKTNAKGEVSFIVRIPEGLDSAKRTAIEKASGFVLTGAIVEASGASTTATSAPVMVSAKGQQSATELSSSTTPSIVNVLQDSFQIQVMGKRPNSSAAVGKTVELTLDPKTAKGLSVESNTATTNSKGIAVFTVNIDPAMTETDRNALIKSGILYSAALTDDDGRVSANFKSQAQKPAAQYQINFAGLSRNELSSFGGSTTVTFRVNNKQGGIVKGQRIVASLPESLTSKGYISLDGDGSATTNDQGEVSYTIRSSGGLSEAQRQELESQKQIILTARSIETSGATSESKSPAITISSKLQQSLSTLATQTDPSVVNVLKDRFDIIVSGKRADGSAAANKAVRLVLDNKTLIADSDDVFTNQDGNARFSISLSKLTQTQRKALVTSGIGYTATLTDDDGVVSIKGNAKAEAPAAQYQINFAGLSRNELSSFGGSTTITFRVNNKQGGIVKGQRIVASLPESLTSKGYISLDGDGSATTNDQGEVSYTIRSSGGLSPAQRQELESQKQIILTARSIETSGATSESKSPAITISSKLQQSLSTLATQTDPSVVNVLKDRFDIIVSG